MDSVFDSPDLATLIFLHVTPRDAARCRLVCRRWCHIISQDRGRVLWGGAHSYAAFSYVLSVFDSKQVEARLLCANGTWTPSFTLKVIRQLGVGNPYDFVPNGLMTEQQLLSICGMVGEFGDYGENDDDDDDDDDDETPRLVKFTDSFRIVPRALKHDGVVCALLEGLMTPDQMAAMPSVEYIKYACRSRYGLAALRKRLITPAQIAAMPTAMHVKYLFCEQGFNALLRGSNTPELFASYSSFKVRLIFSPPMRWGASDDQMFDKNQK